MNTEFKPADLTASKVAKFFFPSLIGVLIFLCPIPTGDGSVTIPLGIMSSWLTGVLKPYMMWINTTAIIVSAIGAVVCTFFKPKAITENRFLSRLFVVGPAYLVIRILAVFIILFIYNEAGHEYIYSPATGGVILSLFDVIIPWFFIAAFVLPLLIDYGIMDYTGTLLRGFVRLVFRLPGRAAIDLLASWIGNSNVGVILTTSQYESGYYTVRESISIATCFSAVSLPFCFLIATQLEITDLFLQMYGVLTVTGIVSAAIMARIWPLKRYPNTYYEFATRQVTDGAPPNIKKTEWALQLAVQRAEKAGGISDICKQGIETFIRLFINVTPALTAVGTLSLMAVEFTPFFDWISAPFAFYLSIFGVAEAGVAAPGVIAGFADMFFPALLGKSIASVQTRFIVCVLSLVQIVYMTDMGNTLLSSKLPVKIHDLFFIYIVKTLIAIPIIVGLTKLIGISG